MSSINSLISKIKPQEIYNFADQDHVGWSSIIPEYSFLVTVISNMKIFEFIKENNLNIKYFVPLSSNIFGSSNKTKQNENSKLNPTSIYGIAKTFYYMFVITTELLINLKFIIQFIIIMSLKEISRVCYAKKIVKTACAIKYNKTNKLELGDINIKIDWGYAKEYVEAA